MNAPRRVTPRRLGAAAVVYGVFVAGWYLGQPVTPDCPVDRAGLGGAAGEYGTEPSPAPPPAPTETSAPTQYPDPDFSVVGVARATLSVTIDSYAVACTDDTSERPRLRAWLDGHWR
ncbi:hypothetical protein L1I79_09505 [Strepomyces sp. STD 3.1]|uniref:hypothetical protein n=1 Tax=Streptomyces sp. NPDC058985 TaxID=3346684 RepID=UPI001F2FA32B|nr:hypothetical protein [Streptomyces sp. STD 3.1]